MQFIQIIIKYLIKNGADVNYCDSDENTPLYAAYKENNISIIKLLIKNGVDINDPELLKDSKGSKILFYLLTNGIIKHKINDDTPEVLRNGIEMLNNYHKIKDIKDIEDVKKNAKFAFDFEKNVILCDCGKEKKYRCSQCQSIGYCSLECQHLDWKKHKKACKIFSYFLKNNI